MPPCGCGIPPPAPAPTDLLGQLNELHLGGHVAHGAHALAQVLVADVAITVLVKLLEGLLQLWGQSRENGDTRGQPWGHPTGGGRTRGKVGMKGTGTQTRTEGQVLRQGPEWELQRTGAKMGTEQERWHTENMGDGIGSQWNRC